jgi:hypothetical protein
MACPRDNVSSTRAIADPLNIELIPKSLPKSERPSIPVNTALHIPPNVDEFQIQFFRGVAVQTPPKTF